jgi:hypothetical protein
MGSTESQGRTEVAKAVRVPHLVAFDDGAEERELGPLERFSQQRRDMKAVDARQGLVDPDVRTGVWIEPQLPRSAHIRLPGLPPVGPLGDRLEHQARRQGPFRSRQESCAAPSRVALLGLHASHTLHFGESGDDHVRVIVAARPHEHVETGPGGARGASKIARG